MFVPIAIEYGGERWYRNGLIRFFSRQGEGMREVASVGGLSEIDEISLEREAFAELCYCALDGESRLSILWEIRENIPVMVFATSSGQEIFNRTAQPKPTQAGLKVVDVSQISFLPEEKVNNEE